MTDRSRFRIVHVTPSFAKGGAERVVIDLANEQAALGHDVTIVAGRGDGLIDARRMLDERVAVKVIAGEAASTGRTYLSLIAWQLRHRAWLRSRDIIHRHLTMGAVFGTAARILVRGLGKGPAIIETYHAVGMAIPRPMRSLHAVLASTRDALVLMARDTYWDRFVTRHRAMPITIIENGVRSPIGRVGDVQQRADYRRRIGIPNDASIVGTVGQFRVDRQPWRHIELFSFIANRLGPDVHFVMAGDGPAREQVEALMAQTGLVDRVKLLGVTPTAAEPASIMDLYITLAVGPVVGIAALEAMFAAVPTIAIQLDPDYTASNGDFVWSSSDLTEVANRAVELLHNRNALVALADMQHSYVVDRYDMAGVAARYDAVYRSVVQAR